MKQFLVICAVSVAGGLFLFLFLFALADTTAAHPTRFETLRGAGKVCTRMVEDRWYGTQIARYWECKDE